MHTRRANSHQQTWSISLTLSSSLSLTAAHSSESMGITNWNKWNNRVKRALWDGSHYKIINISSIILYFQMSIVFKGSKMCYFFLIFVENFCLFDWIKLLILMIYLKKNEKKATNENKNQLRELMKELSIIHISFTFHRKFYFVIC